MPDTDLEKELKVAVLMPDRKLRRGSREEAEYGTIIDTRSIACVGVRKKWRGNIERGRARHQIVQSRDNVFELRTNSFNVHIATVEIVPLHLAFDRENVVQKNFVLCRTGRT